MLPCHEVVRSVASYIIFMLDSHLVKFLMEKLMSGSWIGLIRTCSKEEIINFVIEVRLKDSRCLLCIDCRAEESETSEEVKATVADICKKFPMYV